MFNLTYLRRPSQSHRARLPVCGCAAQEEGKGTVDDGGGALVLTDMYSAAQAVVTRQGPLKQWQKYHQQYGTYESHEANGARAYAELVSLRCAPFACVPCARMLLRRTHLCVPMSRPCLRSSTWSEPRYFAA